MRVIAGTAKGRTLRSPRPGDTRPITDRAKESLFGILAPRIPEARFLDLFAGGGGVGLEALSRGAARVVLVDHSAPAVAAARENAAALLAAGGEVQVFRQDAKTALLGLVGAGARFDVVFLDPPYESDAYLPVLEHLAEAGLAPGGLVVAEHFHKRVLPETIGRLTRVRSVRIGDHQLSFYSQPSPDEQER